MRLFTFLLLIASSYSYAQPCSTIPGMTPANSLPVCGSTTFTQTSVSSCTGPAIQTSCIDDLTTSNSFFYKFTCYQALPPGLGFIISPQSPTDDYDWTVFDITGLANINDIYTQQSLQVSVNLSAAFGPTGSSATGIGNFNCAGATPQWNQLVQVQTGHEYLLMVTNWSNSGLGYGLTFTGGASIITSSAPTVSNVSLPGCNVSQIDVTFSKDILCSSVTPTGSEFVIMPGNITPLSVTSNCASNFTAITSLSINLQNPLPPGNYSLSVINGSDGNSFLDACNTPIPASPTFPFVVNAQPTAPVINSITYSGCAPNLLTVTFSKPVTCNSVTANASEFSIPGGPVVTSVQSACNNLATRTNTVNLILQSPLPFGNYQLVVNNGTDGNTLTDTCGINMVTGYNFPFIINQVTTAPVIQSIDFNECQPDKVTINFDKPVSCNSFSGTSEFTISPGNWPVSSVSSCASGNYTSQVILTLQNNLPGGSYSVNIVNGTDGNTLSDTCFAFIPAGYTKPLIATQAPLPIFDSVSFVKCNPSFIKVYYNKAIRCASISANGSEFSITGPEPVSVISATTNVTCTQGYTNWIILNLSQPINSTGNYTLHNTTGADGNGIIDTCSALQSALETISFAIYVKPDATFASVVGWGCTMDTIHLSHPGGDGVNAWSWSFSDGLTGNTQNTSHLFPVSTVSTSIQLIVSNLNCADTSQVLITLGNAFNAVFTQSADTVCMGNAVTFSDSSPGNNLQYEWQFGDNGIYNGQVPPAHTFTGNQLHNVILICSDAHGCKDSAVSTVYATALPSVGFTGLNNQYCTNKTVSLQSVISGNIESYTWDNGNGQLFQNNPSVTFSYPVQNTYTVKLSVNDRFCGLKEYTATTDVFRVPVVDLGKDMTLCPNMIFEIGIAETAGYTYLWNNGGTVSSIITSPASASYILTVDNHGCQASDDLYVEVLEGCLIRVPGAFTPNNDGLNDILKATNAYLATQFSLKVYNRFGQLLFQTTNPLAGWDGRFKGQDEGPGTFVWMLSYMDPWTHLPVFEKGTTILLR